MKVTYSDHYYKRTDRPGDWYRLPAEYWSREDEELDETWPAAIRKIVRGSDRFWQLELQLTEKGNSFGGAVPRPA